MIQKDDNGISSIIRVHFKDNKILPLNAKQCVFRLGIFMLAIYGAWTHKVFLTWTPFLIKFLGPIQKQLMPASDIIIGGLLIVFSASVIVYGMCKGKRVFDIYVLVLFFIQLSIAFLLTIRALREGRASIALEFIAGNTLLFIAPIILCRKIHDYKFIFFIWIATSVLLSIISIILVSSGFVGVWARRGVGGLINTRMGRCSAISLITMLYMMGFSKKISTKIVIVFLIFLLLIGLFTSLSKGSILFYIICTIIGFIIEAIILNNWHKFKFILGAILAMLIAGCVADLTGFYDVQSRLLATKGFVGSVESREGRFDHYSNEAIKSPILGSGIASARSYRGENDTYPHNIFIEIFIETGLIGLLFLTSFLFLIFILSFKLLMMHKLLCPPYYYMCLVSFLAFLFSFFMSQLTGDIGGNRDIWFFAGIIVALWVSRKRAMLPCPLICQRSKDKFLAMCSYQSESWRFDEATPSRASDLCG